MLEGTASGLMNGLFDGFMWGGITAGVSNVIKPGSFCFIAGTKVLTDSGQKNIEDIEVGDQVLAYDEETGVTAYKPVLHLFRNTTKEWCTVSIRGAEGELYEITSTPGHKYFVPENRVRKDSRAPEHASYAGLSEKWVSACDLKHGDKVLLSDGTLCEVEGVSCKKLSEPETTYNLEVDDFHTYYVSDACVLVHNADCRVTKFDPKADYKQSVTLSNGKVGYIQKSGALKGKIVSPDTAKHGGSTFKLYKELAGNKAKMIGDLDEYGNMIMYKHSSNVGKIFKIISRGN